MTPDLDQLQALLAKATPGPWKFRQSWSVTINGPIPKEEQEQQWADYKLAVAAVNALPALIARVRELERQRDAVAAAVADGLRALDADVIGTGPARKPKRDHGGSTHWDIAEAGAVCHDDCAIEQIKTAALAMRERCAKVCDELSMPKQQHGGLVVCTYRHDAALCAAAIRALET